MVQNGNLQYIEDNPDEIFRFEDTIVDEVTANYEEQVTKAIEADTASEIKKETSDMNSDLETTFNVEGLLTTFDDVKETVSATTEKSDFTYTQADDTSTVSFPEKETTDGEVDFMTQFTDFISNVGSTKSTDTLSTGSPVDNTEATEEGTEDNYQSEFSTSYTSDYTSTETAFVDEISLPTQNYADDVDESHTDGTTIIGDNIIPVTTDPIYYINANEKESSTYSTEDISIASVSEVEGTTEKSDPVISETPEKLNDYAILDRLREVISISKQPNKTRVEMPLNNTDPNYEYDYYTYYDDCEYFVDDEGNYDYSNCQNKTLLNNSSSTSDFQTAVTDIQDEMTTETFVTEATAVNNTSENLKIPGSITILTDGFYYPEGSTDATTEASPVPEEIHDEISHPPKKLGQDVKVSTGFLVKEAPKRSQQSFGPHDVAGNQVRTDRKSTIDEDSSLGFQEMRVESQNPDAPPVKLLVGLNSMPNSAGNQDTFDIKVSSSLFAGDQVTPIGVGQVIPVDLDVEGRYQEEQENETLREGTHEFQPEVAESEATEMEQVNPDMLIESVNDTEITEIETQTPSTTTESSSFFGTLLNMFASRPRPRPQRPSRRPLVPPPNQNENPEFKTDGIPDPPNFPRPNRRPFRPPPPNRFRPPFSRPPSNSKIELEEDIELSSSEIPPPRFPEENERLPFLPQGPPYFNRRPLLPQRPPYRQDRPESPFAPEPSESLLAPPPLPALENVPPKEIPNDSNSAMKKEKTDMELIHEETAEDSETKFLSETTLSFEKEETDTTIGVSSPSVSSTLPPVVRIKGPIEDFIEQVSKIPDTIEADTSSYITEKSEMEEKTERNYVNVQPTSDDETMEPDTLLTTSVPHDMVLETEEIHMDDFKNLFEESEFESSLPVIDEENERNEELLPEISTYDVKEADHSDILGDLDSSNSESLKSKMDSSDQEIKTDDESTVEVFTSAPQLISDMNDKVDNEQDSPNYESNKDHSKPIQTTTVEPKSSSLVTQLKTLSVTSSSTTESIDRYLPDRKQTIYEEELPSYSDYYEEATLDGIAESPEILAEDEEPILLSEPSLSPKEIDDRVNIHNEILSKPPVESLPNRPTPHPYHDIPDGSFVSSPHDKSGQLPPEVRAPENKPTIILPGSRPFQPIQNIPPFQRPFIEAIEHKNVYQVEPPRTSISSNFVGVETEDTIHDRITNDNKFPSNEPTLPPSLPNLQ